MVSISYFVTRIKKKKTSQIILKIISTVVKKQLPLQTLNWTY